MERRTVAVRLAAGDAGGLSAAITLTHGGQEGTLRLHSGRPSGEWSYEVTDEEQEAGRAGFSYRVEYEWGWAREATHRGEAGAGPLVLPLPGPATDGSFPFPRRCPAEPKGPPV